MEALKALGLDPDLLDEDDLQAMERAGRELKLPANPQTADPNQMLNSLRNAGIDVDKIIKKMRGSVAPKKSTRIKRNAPCTCGSGKKYKKCCWTTKK
jgi:uncharacterized protein YecA (UPF0149 family)